MTFSDGRPIERAKSLFQYARVHEIWVQDLAVTLFTIPHLFTTKFTKVHKILNANIITLNYITLCTRRHEKNGEIS